MQDFLLIIDGSSLLSTQFYGNLPREILFAKTEEEKAKHFHKIMKTSSGRYTNGVYGFLRTLFKILKEQQPKYLAVTWDLTRDTFRREIDPDYKGNRDETIEPLKEQFALCQEVLRKLSVPEFMNERYEADDFSGSLSAKFENEIPVRILTKDHDYLQLVTEKTHLWMIRHNETSVTEFLKKYQQNDLNLPDHTVDLNPERVLSEYGVTPDEVPGLKGLQGDSSDNIKGVPGIGPKTATALIHYYHTVGKLYDDLALMTPEKEEELKKFYKEELGIARSPVKTLLKKEEGMKSAEESARMSELLATIKTDIDLGDLKLSDLLFAPDPENVRKTLADLEMFSLSTDFLRTEENTLKAADDFCELSDFTEIEEAAKRFLQEKKLGVFYEENAGLAVSSEKETVLLCESIFVTADYFHNFLEKCAEKKIRLLTYDAKTFYRRFLVLPEDIKVMAYLLNPLPGKYPPEAVWKTELPDASGLSFEEPRQRAESIAYLSFHASEPLLRKISESGMTELFEKIETPLRAVLADMEDAGIRVEKSALQNFSDDLKAKMESLQNRIFETAGSEFNINSPKQLSDVLFTRLAIPYPGKKKGTSYSTAADILQKLEPDYPIVRMISEYRTLSKLRSTYAEGLQEYIGTDRRIHGKFNQTVTATGRISSSEPNLQNIPVREDLGREIRKLFVPEEGAVFIDADYSQIELRVLADLSGDENLIRAYREAQDIHAWTASQAFHVPLSEVTPKMRRDAKAINFGIVYGISSFALSEDLGITRNEAEAYIERYFETYPGVRKYLNDTVEQAKNDGFSKTRFGRIRPLPELRSQNFHERSFGERVAMNAPIQGTASDIIKIAMIRVSDAFKKNNMKTRLILQIHDELLLEAPADEKEKAKELLAEAMEEAAALKVKLEIDLKEGNSWYETK